MFYRFQESLYSSARLMLCLSQHQVIKKTPVGVWIDVYGQKKFILVAARKRYACPTIKEALMSYHARKKRQVRILRHQLKRAEVALKLQHEGDSAYFE